jgi:uncharacterized membrane protein
MKPEITLMIFLYLVFVAVIFQFVPLFTRPGIFFSATVDTSFPRSADGRRLLRSYRLQAALWAAAAIALSFFSSQLRADTRMLFPMLLMIGGSSLSYWLKFREVHARYGERRPEVRRAELSAPPAEKFSPWIWLLPFLALAVTAVYLYLHWDAVPERFPVHWGLDGQPNRWATRDPLHVYAPLLMGAAMNLFLLGFGWLLSRLSRNTVMRHVTIRIMEVLLYPMTFTFIIVALLPFGLLVPVWLIPGLMLLCVAVMIVWSYRQISVPAAVDAVPEPQSDAYWKAGMFYYNPNDPAIFVAKRVGIGYTLNFASKWTWIVLAATLAFIAISIFLSTHAHA